MELPLARRPCPSPPLQIRRRPPPPPPLPPVAPASAARAADVSLPASELHRGFKAPPLLSLPCRPSSFCPPLPLEAFASRLELPARPLPPRWSPSASRTTTRARDGRQRLQGRCAEGAAGCWRTREPVRRYGVFNLQLMTWNGSSSVGEAVWGLQRDPALGQPTCDGCSLQLCPRSLKAACGAPCLPCRAPARPLPLHNGLAVVQPVMPGCVDCVDQRHCRHLRLALLTKVCCLLHGDKAWDQGIPCGSGCSARP
jgi:hypothetical protein